MKILKNITYLSLLSLIFTSCVSTNFYQVYQTKADENITTNENNLSFEDENCIITYNLWQENGNIGFQVYNKTNNNLYLNLEESFYILNGIANNYYKNRQYLYGSSTGVSASKNVSYSLSNFNAFTLFQQKGAKSAGVVQTSNNSIAYNEEKVIIIPAKASKTINEYDINNSLYRDCDLMLYPNKKEINSVNFSKDNSPLVFSNRITYSIGESTEVNNIENSFYVTTITNYPESEITESKHEEYCGETSIGLTKYIKNIAPNKFYLFYKKGTTATLKH